MPLDRTDRRVLRLLQRDGRLTNVELAKRAGSSPASCHRRTRRLPKRTGNGIFSLAEAPETADPWRDCDQGAHLGLQG